MKQISAEIALINVKVYIINVHKRSLFQLVIIPSRYTSTILRHLRASFFTKDTKNPMKKLLKGDFHRVFRSIFFINQIRKERMR